MDGEFVGLFLFLIILICISCKLSLNVFPTNVFLISRLLNASSSYLVCDLVSSLSLLFLSITGFLFLLTLPWDFKGSNGGKRKKQSTKSDSKKKMMLFTALSFQIVIFYSVKRKRIFTFSQFELLFQKIKKNSIKHHNFMILWLVEKSLICWT